MVQPQKYKILFLSKYKTHKAPNKARSPFTSLFFSPLTASYKPKPWLSSPYAKKKFATTFNWQQYFMEFLSWLLQKQHVSYPMIFHPLLVLVSALLIYSFSSRYYREETIFEAQNASVEVISQDAYTSQLIQLEHQPDQMISLKNIDDLEGDDSQQKPVNPVKQLPQEHSLIEEAQKYTSHLIRKGDTLWSISKEYSISIDSILSKNSMHPMDLLKPGSVIKIPSMQGIFHKVRPYDTLAKISSTYRIDPREVRKYNEITDHVLVNTHVFIPNRGYTESQKRLLFGAFFLAPIKGSITSGYGFRTHPIRGEKLFHSGIDIAAPKGFLVYSAASGTILTAGTRGGYGNCVVIKHKLGYETLYAHLDSVAVYKGNKVQKGELIGTVGHSGNATGPHLHFEIKQNGRYLNPRRFVRIPASSLSQNKRRF